MQWQGEGVQEGFQQTELGSPSHILKVDISTTINLPLFIPAKLSLWQYSSSSQ